MRLSLEVITPERIVLTQDIDLVIVPGEMGELGIMARRAPIMAALKPGVVRYKVGEKWDRMAIGGGVLQVTENKCTVLADTAELAQEIDIERARRAEQEARESLQTRSKEDAEFWRIRLALEKNIARIKAKTGSD
jgi:F-type H+-transporting ATPase subunit epsilon